MHNAMTEYRLATIEPWNITEETFRPEMNEIAESIFSLANEYMGTRGTFDEGFAGETMTGCYIGGIYVKEQMAYPWKRKAFPSYANSMLNTVNWLEIQLEVGGELFSLPESRIEGYRRSLDMRMGILTRELVFVAKSGDRTAVAWERFISHDDPHIGAVRIRLKALNHTRQIRLSFALDGRKENRDYATTRTHTRTVGQAAQENDLYIATNIITTGQYTIHRMRVDSPNREGITRSFSSGDKRVTADYQFSPVMNTDYVFDKIVSVWTSRDAGYPYGFIPKCDTRTEIPLEQEREITGFLIEKSLKNLHSHILESYDDLSAAHSSQVSHLWDSCDIEIDGDPASQQGVRYCMFQLLSTYRGRDSFLNIGPKGYSGECYNGRTFWDTESYCLPFYLFNNPEAVKNLLEYRYNTLEPARAQAREFGYEGAIFPWMTMDGTEDTGVWEYWMGEIHINAIIGYAVFIYTKVTGDKSYLHSHGMELLIELARFWASRAKFIPIRNAYAINRVMGPNEFAQGVNNDWYTNYMAKWLLEYVADSIDEMRTEAPTALDDILRRTGFDPAEPANWRQIAAKLILSYSEEMDIFVENDIFLNLNPLSREELDRDRDYPIERKWTIEKIHSHQITKQPDVLLAMFLMRDRFTAQQKRQNYKFYEQRCTHTSSLSPSIHSIIACDVGRYNQAYDYYLWSSRLDLDDFNNNTEEGLHITSMSGTWLNIVCGFGGLVYSGSKLAFAPILPPAWKGYRFKFVYRGRTIQVRVDSAQASLQLLTGEAVEVLLYGNPVTLTSKPVMVEIPATFIERPQPRAILFDLDGVIVDTAHLHYLAWKKIADSENIPFDSHINERLKGVSRRKSFEIILERATRSYSEQEIERLMQVKNDLYVGMLKTLSEKDILPGISAFLAETHRAGYKTAIVSASRNTNTIVRQIGLEGCFDAVITGDHTKKSKPDPEGMLLASKQLAIAPESCVVIEDAAAGVKAAIEAGMRCIGIGDKTMLHQADYAIPSTKYLNLERIRALY